MSLRFPNKVFAIVLLVIALLQLNDPDPVDWFVFYLVGALTCLQHGRHRWDFVAPAVLGCVAALWIAVLGPQVAGVRIIEIPMPMFTAGGKVEIAREIGGLMVVILWMMLLIFKSRARVAVNSS